MVNDKDGVRQKIQGLELSPLHSGKIAEILRKQDVYRQSKALFVSPAPHLSQIRINALVDGKTLLMPGAAIKKGFYLLTPYVIPFKDLGYAVALKGIEKFGKLLDLERLRELHIDLALTDCLAVAPDGVRLGVGKGFFDLAMAILSDVEAVNNETIFGSVGVQEQLSREELPHDRWDVRMQYFLSSEGFSLLDNDSQKLQVFWDALEKKRIRKIEPLWQLYQACFPEGNI